MGGAKKKIHPRMGRGALKNKITNPFIKNRVEHRTNFYVVLVFVNSDFGKKEKINKISCIQVSEIGDITFLSLRQPASKRPPYPNIPTPI